MKCQYCGEREATLQYSKQGNGQHIILHFCAPCYEKLISGGVPPEVAVFEKLAKIGKECKVCGTTASEFTSTLFLGCSECYYEMRDIVNKVIYKLQGATTHKGKRPGGEK
ncbi:MAG: hypothetical protein GX891_01035 [Clostridiales bacterium]|mgnify:FL=1|nr:hypothetical protein [Clostridiales bacterium]